MLSCDDFLFNTANSTVHTYFLQCIYMFWGEWKMTVSAGELIAQCVGNAWGVNILYDEHSSPMTVDVRNMWLCILYQLINQLIEKIYSSDYYYKRVFLPWNNTIHAFLSIQWIISKIISIQSREEKNWTKPNQIENSFEQLERREKSASIENESTIITLN